MSGEPLIFERSVPGRRATRWPKADDHRPLPSLIPSSFLREQPPALPEISELDAVRHFTRLSQLNYSIDTHFYPLGSCTMKYNPKVNDRIVAMPGVAQLHPYQPIEQCQGMLQLLWELEQWLCEICGMQAFSLQPAAGAQGELTGLKIIRAYHVAQGAPRKTVLVPDSAHGTNPASAALSGYQVVQVPSGPDGLVDLAALRALVSKDVAALMLTNPNTLGLFEREIKAICDLMHQHGALVYLDGANLNPLLSIVRPGAMGIDLIQLNLHKTFSTPHGGGGPGAGPVGVVARLAPLLPVPRIEQHGEHFTLNADAPQSIGKVRSFYGNAGILVRAYTYMRTLGREGLERVGRAAIINANYLRERLTEHYQVRYGRHCMHEFVLTLKRQAQQGASCLDIAKRLLDYGFYAPTIYFPLIVEEAMMIEPTETESRETLDAFADALITIAKEVQEDPQRVRQAPTTTPVGRLDEVGAARNLNLRWSHHLSAKRPETCPTH